MTRDLIPAPSAPGPAVGLRLFCYDHATGEGYGRSTSDPADGMHLLRECHAQSKAETWRCKAGRAWDNSLPVIVVATHGDGDNGTIQVAGTTQEASYWVEGFDRRWDFGPRLGPNDLNPRFSFAIHPDGTAVYVDFVGKDKNGVAQPGQLYVCRAD